MTSRRAAYILGTVVAMLSLLSPSLAAAKPPAEAKAPNETQTVTGSIQFGVGDFGGPVVTIVGARPRRRLSVHAPDGFLNAGTAVATGAVSAGTIGVALRQMRTSLHDKHVPLAGLTAAFIFAAQMFNCPVAAGTTGHLLGGALAAVLKNLTPTKTGNRFQIDTPTIVAGVRGTTFYVKVLNINSTYFCLCNGEVHLQDSAGGDKMALEAAHHSAVEYNREDGIFRVTKRPLLYHTDAEMQAFANKIGYTINWKKPDLVN